MIENTYNTSIKIMFNLDREAHRYLVEPISQSPHIKKVFIKRFIQFTIAINNCPKIAIKNVFNLVKRNCLSVTGSNLRNIMLLAQKQNIDELVPEDAQNIPYNNIPESEIWRLSVINEITDVKFGEAHVEGFTVKELNTILSYVCTS